MILVFLRWESYSLWAFLLSVPEPCAALGWAEMGESLGIWGTLQPYEGRIDVVHMTAMSRLLVFLAWLCYLLLTKITAVEISARPQ